MHYVSRTCTQRHASVPMTARCMATALFVICLLLPVKIGYTDGCGMTAHLLFPLFHANIWHLACNTLCLFMMRGQYIPAAAISFICSFLPAFAAEPVMGFSSVLFAVAGIRWGQAGQLATMTARVLPFILITTLLPHVAWAIHLYCLYAGFIYGYAEKEIRKKRAASHTRHRR